MIQDYPLAEAPKTPIERRRRNNLFQEMRGLIRDSSVPMRRESDAVRAKLQRWIELADRAIRGRDSGRANQH